MVTTTNLDELLENEWYHVRHSGEIPEIALHSSIYHLTEDSEGPRIRLHQEHLLYLLDAARQRYLEIILRDITPAHRDTTMYRGVLRSISNWRRFKRFCERHDMQSESIRNEVVCQFKVFLENEIEDVRKNKRQSCINCSYDDIASFALELDFAIDHLHDDLIKLCLNF